jgi:NADH:ubiquinone oxidoreductase subunit B-like Fe-S oxidoreductase
MLTWSLACTPSPASRAMTSLALVFVDVPEPVWNTSMGNCSS